MDQKTNQQRVFLPTEVLSLIISFIYDDLEGLDLQKTLYSCSLVSRQWYSVTVPFLYQRPHITGKNYPSFVETLSLRRHVRGSKGKTSLGRLVRRIDMSHLIYHGSKSVTARLIGGVKENLEVFIAPAVSFTSISLSSVSKCKNLRILDLSLVMAPIDFVDLKRALQRLHNLETLRFPRQLSNDQQSNIQNQAISLPWPPKLKRLQIGGKIDRRIINHLNFPETISSLTIIGLSSIQAAVIIQNLFKRLRRLRILSTVSDDPEMIILLSHFMQNLIFLSIPRRYCYGAFFQKLNDYSPRRLLPLEILDFTSGISKIADISSISDCIWEAIANTLPKLRLLGFHSEDAAAIPDSFEAEFDAVAKQNAMNAGYSKEEVESGEIQTGIYFVE